MRISSRISKKQNQAKGLPMVYVYTPNMFIAERFLSDIVKTMGNMLYLLTEVHGTWYPQACEFLKIQHHIHSSIEKSLI